MPPPLTERDYDWHAIAHACDVDHADLQRAGSVLAPGLDALCRELARRGRVTVKRVAARRTPPSSERGTLHRGADQPEAAPRRRGPRAKPIVEFPESDGRPWTDPPSFADALDLHMRRHGDTAMHLARVLEASAAQVDVSALKMWRRGVNPYTGRGAIKGLLPHGPHNVRDVLATHILKKTGSYEQASYAIQDTSEMVAKHCRHRLATCRIASWCS